MKIGPPINKAVDANSGQRAEASATATGSAGKASLEGGVNQSAKVTLSSAATGLMTGSDSDFDANKVAQVKQAIDNGSYQVNAGAIADKLISNSKELLQPAKRV